MKKNLEVESIRSEFFNKEAFEIRRKAAEEIRNSWTASPKCSKNSHYEMYKEVLSLPSGENAFYFNDAVTDHALTKYVLTSDNPFRVTYLSAKVIEQSFYQFYDPVKSTPIKNLSIAKHFGTFFTPPDIADLMARCLESDRSTRTLLDPCVGSGVLLCAALLANKTATYSHIIGIELDAQMAVWAKAIVTRVAQLVGYSGIIDIKQGNGLAELLNIEECPRLETWNIIINPPYGRFRLTADRATNIETAFSSANENNDLQVKKLQTHFAETAKLIRQSTSLLKNETGILEYSRIFFRICAQIVAKGGRVVIITPDSWLCGNDGANLRKFVINARMVDEIVLVPEDGKKFSTVNQSTAITHLNLDPRTGISLALYNDSSKESGFIPYEEIVSHDKRHMVIPRVAGNELLLYRRLNALQKFGSIEWLKNARGELDQTLQRSLFVEERTNAKLVRGEHIERFRFLHSSTKQKPSYLDEDGLDAFLSGKPKARDLKNWRVVGRQCSYAQQKRRLIFGIVPPDYAIGNSCNYIVVQGDQENQEDKRYLILGLLSSATLDWFFRVANSNNHVGNYEIDGLPYPKDSKWLDLISNTTKQCEQAAISGQDSKLQWLQALLEAAVALSYGLEPESELRMILERVGGCDVERAVNYAIQFQRGIKIPQVADIPGAYNHGVPSLSELDRLIISHVPEGGNWQNIPDSVPSERLKQIREMTAERGVVRTTYYGRLRRDQPAYTINTYFNRPGNGTHIHPVLDRTLTSREAARLQSFPDSYLFTGSEGAIRNQIGNAVPPLLAKSVGEKLLPYRVSGLCVDMFGGAGGLSLGLESAGWHVMAAVDYDRDALDTYSLNRPCDMEPQVPRHGKTAIYRRDLHTKESFADIVSRVTAGLKGQPLDILAGGPPCQGFSHAGFRLHNDMRNDLASIYLHFAEILRPRIFILENVEGLATFKQGQVLRDICQTLREFGYRVVEPVWRLNAEQYGVPQMRRRVFVVATLDSSVDLSPPIPTHEKCAGRRAEKIASLFEPTLSSPTTVAVALAGLSLPRSEQTHGLTDWLENYAL